MADANKTLITRAEVTSIITPASKRRALVIDGVTIELGDTGPRDLSGMITNVVSGRLLVQRVGQATTYSVVNIQTPESMAGQAVTILPGSALNMSPFRPFYTVNAAHLAGSNGQMARLVVAASGAVQIHYAQPGVSYSGALTFVNSAGWPATLPGVEDGQPVVI
jgi:hypothetical protein